MSSSRWNYIKTARISSRAFTSTKCPPWTLRVLSALSTEGWAVPLPAADKNTQEIFVSFDNYMAEILSSGDVEAKLAEMQDEFNGLLAE